MQRSENEAVVWTADDLHLTHHNNVHFRTHLALYQHISWHTWQLSLQRQRPNAVTAVDCCR